MYNKITDPMTNETYLINSNQGKQLLKQYVKKLSGGAYNNSFVCPTCPLSGGAGNNPDPNPPGPNQIDYYDPSRQAPAGILMAPRLLGNDYRCRYHPMIRLSTSSGTLGRLSCPWCGNDKGAVNIADLVDNAPLNLLQGGSNKKKKVKTVKKVGRKSKTKTKKSKTKKSKTRTTRPRVTRPTARHMVSHPHARVEQQLIRNTTNPMIRRPVIVDDKPLFSYNDHVNLGKIYREQGDLEDAEEHFSIARTLKRRKGDRIMRERERLRQERESAMEYEHIVPSPPSLRIPSPVFPDYNEYDEETKDPY